MIRESDGAKVMLGSVEILLQSLIFVTGMVIVCYEPLGYGPEEYWRCMMAIVAVAYTYILRHMTISNRRFYMMHIVLLVIAVIFGRNDNESFMYTLVMLIMTGFSVQTRYKILRADRERPSYLFIAVMVYGFISGKVYGSSIVMQTSVTAFVLYTVLSVLHNNIFRMSAVFNENHAMANFPDRQIKRVNRVIIGVTVMAMLGVMLVVYGIGEGHFTFLGEAGIVIGRIIAQFIIWLLEMLGKLQPKAEGSPVISEESQQDVLSDFTSDNGNGDIERLINAVIIVSAVIIVTAVIIAIIRVLNRYMGQRTARAEGADTIEFVRINEKTENITARHTEPDEAGRDNAYKYRKLYRKMVRRGYKKAGRQKPDVSMLPSDITLQNITHDKADAALITEYYEKARYSGEPLDKDALDAIRKMKKTD